MASIGITQRILTQAERGSTTPSSVVKKTLDEHTKQLERMFQLVFLGFVVLIVMVATIVISGFWNYQNAINESSNAQASFYYQLQRERYDLLNHKIDFLMQIITTQSAQQR